MRRVFGKTLVYEFLISYCHTEWMQLQVHVYSERRSGNNQALINLNLYSYALVCWVTGLVN